MSWESAAKSNRRPKTEGNPVSDAPIQTPRLTAAQLDRLGDRLKKRELDRDSLVALATFRNSFIGPTQDVAIRIARSEPPFNIDITQRPAKSTASIIAKLFREHARLTQIQDIGGLRLIVSKTSVQNKALGHVLKLYPDSRVVDRRELPKHSYRAIHVIVREQSRLIEVQIRTRLQNGWAQYSEKLADTYGNDLKYGGGHEATLQHLKFLSDGVKNIERLEQQADGEQRLIRSLRKKARDGVGLSGVEKMRIAQHEQLRKDVRVVRQGWLKYFRDETGL